MGNPKLIQATQITLLGLGNGNINHLTKQAIDWLKTIDVIYVMKDACIIQELLDGIVKVELFFTELEFGDIEEITMEHFLQAAASHDETKFTLAIPGNPMTDEPICKDIVKWANEKKIQCQVFPGMSMMKRVYEQLGLTHVSKLSIISAEELAKQYFPGFPSTAPVLITNIKSNKVLRQVVTLLQKAYPTDHIIKLLQNNFSEKGTLHSKPLENICEIDIFGNINYLYADFVDSNSSFEAFQDLIAHLRSPEGCSWDRKQTHQSLRPDLLEEAYEALTALDEGNPEKMVEEFGDLLLQIVLHAQIGVEEGEFKMIDILQKVQNKMIYRHPHVFGEVEADEVETVLSNWEMLKSEERKKENNGRSSGILHGVPMNLPALSQAQEIQKRAARVGFDWDDIEPVKAKIQEEYQEVLQAFQTENGDVAGELGDLLFSVVNLIRWLKVDAESALRASNLKFRKRFEYVEEMAGKTGQDIQKMTLNEMDKYWDEAKTKE
ncbi:MAG: nucleoside triphosphate pyrophosphohydrolase [Anaerolineaceae bacterium]|nr:nucleoside triphosphate pyrophosphohydrolase [Anaerolineaceae bacterium]